MHEMAKVSLENEMDLILAHKRSMKLAEIAGLSLSAQTTFATAVSEVARNTIDSGKSGRLILNVEIDQRDKYIVACIKDEHANNISRDGLEYAKRLVNKYNISTKGTETSIELYYYISPSFKIDIQKLDEWRLFFRNEPPISPYEELKRKNEQLQKLSEKVQKSDTQFKTLTNSLPLIIFSLDLEGQLLYTNEWLIKYSGESIESLNKSKWKSFVHEDDYHTFLVLLENKIGNGEIAIRMQARLLDKAKGEYLWHQLSLTPYKDDNGNLQYWTGFIVDIHAQKIVEETLKDNRELKQIQIQLKESQQTQERYIEELNRSNQELQQFAFIASHDLQEPLRKLVYYSDYLINQYSSSINEYGIECLTKMQNSANRMRMLIKDILVFSQIDKERISLSDVDLNSIADHARQDFELVIEEKKAVLIIGDLPVIRADERMMMQLFENIISNSLKYSKKNSSPEIHIKSLIKNDCVELSFKDNGLGFDEKYLTQMFTHFQRLHNYIEFEGTGLGLAICRKIAEMHNGKIWAESKEGEGATFYVSLPTYSNVNNQIIE